MRQHLLCIGALCVLLVASTDVLRAQAARDRGACAQIRTACQNAGFSAGSNREGTGLQADCIAPIMRGSAQPKKASKPLPTIDAQLVADCKASNPRFGQGRDRGTEPPPDAAPEKAPAPATPPPGSENRQP
jgi:hypothetical protein